MHILANTFACSGQKMYIFMFSHFVRLFEMHCLTDFSSSQTICYTMQIEFKIHKIING